MANFVRDASGNIINTDYVCQFYRDEVNDQHMVSAHFITSDFNASKTLFKGTEAQADDYHDWLMSQLNVAVYENLTEMRERAIIEHWEEAVLRCIGWVCERRENNRTTLLEIKLAMRPGAPPRKSLEIVIDHLVSTRQVECDMAGGEFWIPNEEDGDGTEG